MTNFDKMMEQLRAMADSDPTPIVVNEEYLRNQTIGLGLEVSEFCKELMAKIKKNQKLLRGDVGVFMSLLGGLQVLMTMDKQAKFLPEEPETALKLILMAGVSIARTELLTNFEESGDEDNPFTD